MHPKKAEMLASWDEITRTQESLLASVVRDAVQPNRLGLIDSALSAVLIPIVAASTVVAHAVAGATALIPDAQWSRIHPEADRSAGME